MDIEVYTYFENVPFKEAVVRYRFNPDEVANRKESDKINLIRADYICDGEEGVRDIGIPTCARNYLAEPATDLDREVYQAMVDEGMLQAIVTGVDISLYGYYNDNVPVVDFECGFTGSDGMISRTINPIEPGDTPKMPMFVWEAAVAKAREAMRRFNDLMATGE